MLGIIGGAFDPIHYGHLRIALEAHEALGLEQLQWIPTGQPPHRQAAHATAQQRLEMLRLALAEQPQWQLDSRELERSGPSFMVDTLTEIREEQGRQRPIVLILGEDAFTGLSSWSRWQQLWSLAHILVCTRPGSSQALDKLLEQECRKHEVAELMPLQQSAAGSLYRLQVNPLDIASSRIRDIIQRRQSPRFLLPDAVLQYIEANHLYMG